MSSSPPHIRSSLIYSDDCQRGRLQRGAAAGPCLHLTASHTRVCTIPGRTWEPFPTLDVFPGSQGTNNPPPSQYSQKGAEGWHPFFTRSPGGLCHAGTDPTSRLALPPRLHPIPTGIALQRALGWATPAPPQLLGSSHAMPG